MKPNKNISNQVIPRYSYLIINLTVSLFNFILLRINKNIEAKSKLLLNPLFPTLKKGIIHLLYLFPKFLNFSVLFFKHKITNFWELLLL